MSSLRIRVDIQPGTHITAAALDMICLAQKLNCEVYTEFNGVELYAWDNTLVETIVESFKTQSDK